MVLVAWLGRVHTMPFDVAATYHRACPPPHLLHAPTATHHRHGAQRCRSVVMNASIAANVATGNYVKEYYGDRGVWADRARLPPLMAAET